MQNSFKSHNKVKCSSCNSQNISDDHKQNMRICTDCGTVIGDCNDVTMAQTFSNSQQNNITEHYQSLGAFVDKKYKMTQLRINQTTNSKAQNRMKNLSKKLENISYNMGLVKRISDRASVLMFKSLKNKRMKRIKKDELLAAVCIVLAAREARIQFTFREISEACENVTKKEICRVYKQHERVLNKQVKGGTKLDVDQIRFEGMISRFTSLLGIAWLEQKKIRKLYYKVNKQPELSTLNPLTRLACSIYIIMGQEKNNCRMVSLACNVSEHTIIRSTELISHEIELQ